MNHTFQIFAEQDFESVTRALTEKLKAKINAENPDYLLNVNRTEYLAHLISDFEISPLKLEFEHKTVSPSEQMITAEAFRPGFSVTAGKAYNKQVITYHIPLSGDVNLLRCIPNPRLLNSYPVTVVGNEVCFELVDWNGDAQQIKASADSVLKFMREQAAHLENNVAQYNQQLRAQAESLFDGRRAQILKQIQVVAALDVPVRKTDNVPQTFAVRATARKRVLPKPAAPSEKYAPEPTLDESIYTEILRVIFDTGRGFERLPSTYSGRDEETLRDHLILVLEPHFQIATTGETFNKKGKTDILMRYEGKNVFVAECKFWRGQKQHQETIDQLLSYLTWRDSKTAIVYFVDTKEIGAPLKAIEDTTASHPCFVSLAGKREESWFRYEFHLPGDHNRPVHISILCFHLPKQ